MSEMKTCTKCNKELPVECFGKRVGGLQSWCKTCTNEAVRSRQKDRYKNDKDYRRKVLDGKSISTQAERARATQDRAKWLRQHHGIDIT